MPAAPLPEQRERAEAAKKPDRAEQAHARRRQSKFLRNAGHNREQRVDGDVGKRIRQPRHFEKRLRTDGLLKRRRFESVMRFFWRHRRGGEHGVVALPEPEYEKEFHEKNSRR